MDSRLAFKELVKYSNEFVPEMVGKIEHYSGDTPLFDLYDVENEIQRAAA